MGLFFHPNAFSGLHIPPQENARLLQKIEWLWANRAVVTHFPLGENLSGFYKRRVGKYRIIYTYNQNLDDMTIRLVGHRDDIYEQLK